MSESNSTKPSHETKLGVLIDANAGRDAVHVALAPMQAKERLNPGEHFGFAEPGNQKLASKFATVKIGIVDPYLPKPVEPQEWFYGCLYPQTTTGLRHVWTHPEFPEVAAEIPHEWVEIYSASLGGPLPMCKYCGINSTHANAQKGCSMRTLPQKQTPEKISDDERYSTSMAWLEQWLGLSGPPRDAASPTTR